MNSIKKTFIRNQTESNKERKQNERKQKRENLIDEDIDLGNFFELASSDKIYVSGLNLHEIKNELLLDCRSDCELNGLLDVGFAKHKVNNRIRNIDDFESYINAIDIENDSGHVAFTGYVYEINTPQFNIVKRSVYPKGANYMQEIVAYRGQSCYLLTSRH